MNEIKLKITIDGKKTNASIQLTDKQLLELGKSVRKVSDDSRDLGSSMVHGFAQARNLIQGLKESFSMLSTALGSLITAYGQQELGERKLQTALQQTGNYTQVVMEDFKNYASQL